MEQIYLVEVSPALRDAQKQLLCGEEPFEEVDDGMRCKSKYLDLPITWNENIRYVPNGGYRFVPLYFSLIIIISTLENSVHFCSRIFRYPAYPCIPVRKPQPLAIGNHNTNGAITSPEG